MRLEALVFFLALATISLSAQEAPPTPRQAYQRAEALFAQGHVFTAEEETALAELRASLVDTGDTDLAASLDLLRRGSEALARSLDARIQAKASLEQDTQLWADRDRFLKNRGFWRSVRDGGLIVFTTATAATLLLAVTNDRNESLMRNGYYNDWAAKRAFSDGMNWAIFGSATTMFFSLFPLLWGEARQ